MNKYISFIIFVTVASLSSLSAGELPNMPSVQKIIEKDYRCNRHKKKVITILLGAGVAIGGICYSLFPLEVATMIMTPYVVALGAIVIPDYWNNYRKLQEMKQKIDLIYNNQLLLNKPGLLEQHHHFLNEQVLKVTICGDRVIRKDPTNTMIDRLIDSTEAQLMALKKMRLTYPPDAHLKVPSAQEQHWIDYQNYISQFDEDCWKQYNRQHYKFRE